LLHTLIRVPFIDDYENSGKYKGVYDLFINYPNYQANVKQKMV
jgi:hypothetical protein